MRPVLPFVVVLGIAACSGDPGASGPQKPHVTAAAQPAANDSIAAVAQSAGQPVITLRYALDGKPAVGATTHLRLDLSGPAGPLSLSLQGEGLVLDPRSMALTIAEDGKTISESVALTPQGAGLTEVIVKLQSTTGGGQEFAYAVPLLVEAAAH